MVCPCKKQKLRQLGLYVDNRQVNNIMQKQQPTVRENDTKPSPRSPQINEAGSVNVSGYVRVFDPESQETLVEARE